MPLKVLSCPVCRSALCEINEHAEPPYLVVRCLDCDLVYVDPIPDVGELSRHYNQDYYAEWISTQRKKRERMWARRLKRIESMTNKGRILDVGCGEGLFLELAQKNRWQVEGTELSPFAARHASTALQRSVFGGELWEAGFPAHFFDVVTMWHVLEHTRDPLKVVKEARRVLKAEGYLILAVPNVNDHLMRLAYRIVKGHTPRLFSPEDKELHFFHFSAKTIQALLERSGFGCIYVRPDFGIVEVPKRLINFFAAIPYYFGNFHISNALEIAAIPAESGRA
jgi:SAM-dependent methyltransferase